MNNQEIAFFNEHGFAGLFTLLTEEEMKLVYCEILKGINILKFFTNKKYRVYEKRNRHLDLPLISRLCLHSAIVERVSKILRTDDLTLWRSNLFFAMLGNGISRHQDVHHGLLSDTDNHISVHLAINKVTHENCLSIIPGSHKLDQEDLKSKYGLEMLKSSDSGTYGVPFFRLNTPIQKYFYKILLNPGEFFIFHPRLVHTSQRNSDSLGYQQIQDTTKRFLTASSIIIGQIPPSEWLRVGLGIRFTTPNVKVFPAAFAETQPRNDRCVLIKSIPESHSG